MHQHELLNDADNYGWIRFLHQNPYLVNCGPDYQWINTTDLDCSLQINHVEHDLLTHKLTILATLAVL
jgi:hypothetical protein